MDLLPALGGVTLLDAVLLASFVFWIFGMYAAWRLFRVKFCQVCVAVSSVWILNLAFPVLPLWATVLLMGQSVAGAAGLGRDRVSARFRFDERPDRERRLLKQLTYFALVLGGTLAAASILLLAHPELAS